MMSTAEQMGDGSGGAAAWPPAEGVARVGAELAAARERLGWDLGALSAGLRIRLPYLQALEEGRVRDLPGEAYAVGFLRTYATTLGLDAAEMIRRYKAGAADLGRKPELTFPAPVPERGIPAGAMLLLAVFLAVGAYVGWYRLSGEGRLPAEVVPPVPERLAPLASQAVPPSSPPSAQPTAPAIPAPVAAAPSGYAMPNVPPSSAAAMPLPPMPDQAPARAEPTDPALASAPAAPAPAANGDEPRMVVRARADSWVQVRDKSGQVLLNRVLRPGDTWPVPGNKPALLLTTGNAGGTELLVDGIVAPAIGGPGVVKRDLPLDPDAIKSGKLPAQMQASAAPAPQAPARTPPAAGQ